MVVVVGRVLLLCHLSNQKQKQISKRDVRDSIQILNHIYDILQDGIMTMYHETLS